MAVHCEETNHEGTNEKSGYKSVYSVLLTSISSARFRTGSYFGLKDILTSEMIPSNLRTCDMLILLFRFYFRQTSSEKSR